MASWTQKKQLLAIGGGAGLVCALAISGVFYAQGLIDEINVSIESKQQAISAAETKIAQIPSLEKQVVILRENLDEYVKILPDSKELNEFVRMLNQFERQSGIIGSGLVLKNAKASKDNVRFTLVEYTYEGTSTMWEFLKFVNLIENYDRFVTISEFSIQSGDKGRGEEMRGRDVVHSMRLTLQTYSYNGKSTGKDVVIPDYDALVAALSEEIWKGEKAIPFEKYTSKNSTTRRDILVDPRLREDMSGSGASPAEQRAILDKYIGEVKSLKDMQQRLRRQDTTMFEQYALEKQIRELLAKLATNIEADAAKLTYGPYRMQWGEQVVAPLEAVKAAFDNGPKPEPKDLDPYLPQKELEQLVAQLEADCAAGQLEDAKQRFELVASRLGVKADDPRHALAVAAKAWHVKATTALDFRALDLKLQGVVVNRGGRSGVLINGEVYEEGEYVSDDLLVKQVEEEQVWFVFRGLTLVRTL
jgi:Tfp pilus assembly protein PilO